MSLFRFPLLAELERDMAEAAAALAFERAAALRDQLEALRWLHNHLQRLREARQRFSYVYPVRGHQGNDLWYLIHRGRVAAAVPLPRDAPGQQTAAACIEAVYHRKPSPVQPASAGEVDGVLLVAAWFRKHPDQQALLLAPTAALALCQEEPARGSTERGSCPTSSGALIAQP